MSVSVEPTRHVVDASNLMVPFRVSSYGYLMVVLSGCVQQPGEGATGERSMSTLNVSDAAQYILDAQGQMTTWKLQKLVYYSQAWSLVWDEEPLFAERVEAWANGPVVRELYGKHRGQYRVRRIPGGNPDRLEDEQRATIDAVLDAYGDMAPWQLSELTHREDPWKDARERARLKEGDRGSAVISHESMAEYYGSLG